MQQTGVPYWRLSSFYFVYFASLGALIPYWGLYLQSLHFSATEIGELMAIIMATKFIAPYFWGWIADHRGERMRIIQLGAFAASITFFGVFFVTSYWPLALVMAVFSFFWNASLPQFEAATLNHLGARTHLYTRIRLWGSVGFVVTVAVMGEAMDLYGALTLPVVVSLCMAGIWLVSLGVPESAAGHQHLAEGSFRQRFRDPSVIALFLACMLMQASHGPYYTFFSIYLKDYHYDGLSIGLLWAWGVVAEVILFVFMHRLLQRYGLRGPFMLAFALTAVRWVLTAYFPQLLPVIIFSQALHAASFGLYHGVAILLIHRVFTGRFQGRGQALYSSLSFGAGGALGSLIGGYTWAGLGPTTTYLLCAGMALAGLLLVWRYVGREPTTL